MSGTVLTFFLLTKKSDKKCFFFTLRKENQRYDFFVCFLFCSMFSTTIISIKKKRHRLVDYYVRGK